MPATIRILSAGAPKLGVERCAKAFSRKTGHGVDLAFATAPSIREKMDGGGAGADILVAPAAHMADYARDGKTVAGTEVTVGTVTAGVAIREGAAPPDLSSVEGFKRSLLAADAILYNTASSGKYIEQLMEKFGLAEALAAKTERFASGAEVMVRLSQGTAAREIAFGQITEIRRFENGGVVLAGPLPAEVGKKTTYIAALLAEAASPAPARALLRSLASAEARRIYAEAGLE